MERPLSNGPRNQAPFHAFIALYVMAFLLPNFLTLIHLYASAGAGLAVYLKPSFQFQLLILPLLTIGQFMPQIRLLWRERPHLEAMHLDIPAFAMDTVLFILIGVSWRQYIAETSEFLLAFWYGLTHPLSWVQFAAWMWFNYVVLGMGQGFVLASYLYLRWRDVRKVE